MKAKVQFATLGVFTGTFAVVAVIHWALRTYLGETGVTIAGWLFVALVAVVAMICGRIETKQLFRLQKFQWPYIFVLVLLGALFAVHNIYFIDQAGSFDYKGKAGLIVLQLTISSISEELLYRGFIQTYINTTEDHSHKLISKGNYWATTLMTVTHLGFFTIMSPLHAASSVLLVLIFSLAAGYLRDRSGGIVLPVIAHLLVNYVHLGVITL